MKSGKAFRRALACFLPLSATLCTLTTAHAGPQVIPGKYIVLLKEQADKAKQKANRGQIMKELRLAEKNVDQTLEGLVQGFSAKLDEQQLEKLKKHPLLKRIEPDLLLTVEPLQVSTENAISPYSTQVVPWNITRVGGYGNGVGRNIWVIDSGVDTDHPDLTVSLSRGKSFIPDNFSVEDGCGHGTSVSGIIAAKDNTIGIVGVAAGATIIPMRVFDDACTGTMSRAIAAVNHIHSYGSPGDTVNLSLGGGSSLTFDDAVRNTAARGIYFAIAAGNSNTDCSLVSPARVNATHVYTISAIDKNDVFTSFSSWGSPVDFAAPGQNVSATTIGGGYNDYHTGTSFAAPHVAGILALHGRVGMDGYVIGDRDAWQDRIASRRSLVGTSPSPSPTVTATSSPAPTATVSPAPSPTPTVTASPSPSPRISASPSPSPTVAPSPSPSPTLPPPPADLTPPSVMITSPVSGSTVQRRSYVTITASASDNVGVSQVRFLVDGSLICTDSTAPYSCSWKTPNKRRTVSIEAQAFDQAGNVKRSSVIQVGVR